MSDAVGHNDTIVADHGFVEANQTIDRLTMARVVDAVAPVCEAAAVTVEGYSAYTIQEEWLRGVGEFCRADLSAVIIVLLRNVRLLMVEFPFGTSRSLEMLFNIARDGRRYLSPVDRGLPDEMEASGYRHSVLDMLDKVEFRNDIDCGVQWDSLGPLSMLLKPPGVSTASIEVPVLAGSSGSMPLFDLASLETLEVTMHARSTSPSDCLAILVDNATNLRALTVMNFDYVLGRGIVEWDWPMVNEIILGACSRLRSLRVAADHSRSPLVPLLPFDRVCRLVDLDVHLRLLLPRGRHMQSRSSVMSCLAELPPSVRELTIRCCCTGSGDSRIDVVEEHGAAYNAVNALLSQRFLPGSGSALERLRLVVDGGLDEEIGLREHRETLVELCRQRGIRLDCLRVEDR